jgi:hypothetical protein
MSDSPSTATGDSAKNPEGQKASMAGSTGCFNPPNQDMHSSKNMQIDPTGSLGCKGTQDGGV